MTVLPYGRGVGKVGKGKNPTSAPSAVDGPPPLMVLRQASTRPWLKRAALVATEASAKHGPRAIP